MFTRRLLTVFIVANIFFFFKISSAFASNLYLSPGSGNISQGQVLPVQVSLATGGESVNAVSAYLSYPADKLEVAWVSYSSSPFNILAEENYGNGVIKISRGNVSGSSGNLNVATIGFRGKSLGNANVSFSPGSAAPRVSDSSDSMNLSSSRGGSYNVIEPAPEPPKDTTAPKISEISVKDVSTSSATISWKTDEKADSELEFGLEKGVYFLSKYNADLSTEHTLKLEGTILLPGNEIHFRVKAKDGGGNTTLGEDQTLLLNGYNISVKVLDDKKLPVARAQVTLYSKPKVETTDENGEVVFADVAPGKHVAVVKLANREITKEIEVQNAAVSQRFEVVLEASSLNLNFLADNSTYLLIIIGVIAFLLLSFATIFWLRKMKTN